MLSIRSIIFYVDITGVNESCYMQPYEAYVQKGGKEYVVFRTFERSTQTRAKLSDISLRTLHGTRSVVMQHIHCDTLTIRRVVPSNECLVSPAVRFHVHELVYQQNPEKYKYILTLPHVLPPDCDTSLVRVRYGNIKQPELLNEMAKNEPICVGEPYFEVKKDVIEVHANHFCDIISTCDGKICTSKVLAIHFGTICTEEESNEVRTHVQMKTYLCSYLYSNGTYKSVCYLNL